jgi:hypothetical protein
MAPVFSEFQHVSQSLEMLGPFLVIPLDLIHYRAVGFCALRLAKVTTRVSRPALKFN